LLSTEQQSRGGGRKRDIRKTFRNASKQRTVKNFPLSWLMTVDFPAY